MARAHLQARMRRLAQFTAKGGTELAEDIG